MTMRRSWILVWRFNRWIPSSITSTLVEFRKMLAILRMRSYSRPGDAKDDPLSLSMRFSWSWRSLGSSCLSIVHIEVSPSTIARLSWDISDRRHFPGPEESSHLPLIRRSFSRLWGHQARAELSPVMAGGPPWTTCLLLVRRQLSLELTLASQYPGWSTRRDSLGGAPTTPESVFRALGVESVSNAALLTDHILPYLPGSIIPRKESYRSMVAAMRHVA
jgi:hypothetical protein